MEEKIPDPRVVTLRMPMRDLAKIQELVRERRYLNVSDFIRHSIRMLFFIDGELPDLSELVQGFNERLAAIEETIKELNNK